MATMRGRFIPKNPEKYVGNPNQILFRSSWERSFMIWLDTNNAISRWASEELAIPYVSPLDNRVHRYFPDFIILYQDITGMVKKEIIEIKPYKESIVTKNMSDRDKKALIVNEAKWKAAAEFAERNNSTFRVLTERSLFAKKPQRKKALGSSV